MLRNCCVSCWDVNVPCTPCTCAHAPCYATASCWDVYNVPCTCARAQCYATAAFLLGCYCSLHLHTCSMLRNCCVSCWDVNVPCTCARAQGYATAAFLLGCYCSLHLHTCSMLRNCCVSCWDVTVPTVPCTCTHAQCYATAAFLAGMLTFLALLALAHMLHATQLLLAGMLTFLALAHVHNATQLLRSCWDVTVRCTCTHAPCYATAAFLAGMLTFLALAHVHKMLRNCCVLAGMLLFVALAHMLHATQLLRFLLGCYCSLHLHTCSMLRNCCVSCWDVNVPCIPCTCAHAPCYATASCWDVNVPCTCARAQCYATAAFLLGCYCSLHLHTCSMLRNCCVSCWDVNVPCTCARAQCYATAAFLAGMLTFLALLALAHVHNATQLLRFLLGCYCSLHLHTCSMLRNCFLLGCYCSLHLHTCSMLRNCCVSCWDVNVPCTPCTCTHAPCYATAALLAGMLLFVALAHMLHATQLLRFLLGTCYILLFGFCSFWFCHPFWQCKMPRMLVRKREVLRTDWP